MLSSSRSIRSASSTRYSTLSSPRAAPRRRAASTISGEKSVDSTLPPAPTRAAAWKPRSPGPAAMSRAVWPGRGSAFSTIHSLTRPVTPAIHSLRSSQPGAIFPQVSRLCSR